MSERGKPVADRNEQQPAFQVGSKVALKCGRIAGRVDQRLRDQAEMLGIIGSRAPATRQKMVAGELGVFVAQAGKQEP